LRLAEVVVRDFASGRLELVLVGSATGVSAAAAGDGVSGVKVCRGEASTVVPETNASGV
jgi:hypothetical protein